MAASPMAASPTAASSVAGGASRVDAPGVASRGAGAVLKAPSDLAGWAVAVGSVLTSVSVILPWAANGVAGAPIDRSYFGQWGIANPAYLALVVASLVTLLLTITPNRLPPQVRSAALPLVLGGFLGGLGWSYATGPFGTGPGVDTMFAGAVLLVVGGSLGLRTRRPEQKYEGIAT